jgi:hypothetical protein
MLLLFNSTANGLLPVAVVTTIRHNTLKYTSHKITQTLRQNSTKNYTNNGGRFTHNEYNTKKKVKFSP